MARRRSPTAGTPPSSASRDAAGLRTKEAALAFDAPAPLQEALHLDRRGACASGVLRLYAGEAGQLFHRRGGDGPRLIVTPNLDHLRLLSRRRSLRRAYARADVVVNDSRFLDRAFLEGRALCFPGSEFAPERLRRVPAGGRVLVVGGSPALFDTLRAAFPRLAIDALEPSLGFVFRRAERRALVERARAGGPELILVCTGAPQSELLAAQLRRALTHACDIVCCGGALQFMAGEKRRAPGWMRALGVEWAHRFLCEPHTRARYLADAAFLLRATPALLALRRTGQAHLPGVTLETAATL